MCTHERSRVHMYTQAHVHYVHADVEIEPSRACGSGVVPLSTLQFFGLRACAFAFLCAFGYLLFLYALLKAEVSFFIDTTPQPLELVSSKLEHVHRACNCDLNEGGSSPVPLTTALQLVFYPPMQWVLMFLSGNVLASHQLIEDVRIRTARGRDQCSACICVDACSFVQPTLHLCKQSKHAPASKEIITLLGHQLHW